MSLSKIPPTPTTAQYEDAHLAHAKDFDEGAPMVLFSQWFEDAKAKEINDPNAMAVATVDQDGMPDVRMVLLKDFDDQGFVFYTNTQSAKGQQILASKKLALLFHWKTLRRQVRIRGDVDIVSPQESDDYFHSRARQSQIGAWASLQSREIKDRFSFEKRIAEYTLKFGIGAIPRPDFWLGFRIKPVQIEFWRDKPFRLHDRILYSRTSQDEKWETARLYP
jgi:pyridoxamine 5'-phosphate oxidase